MQTECRNGEGAMIYSAGHDKVYSLLKPHNLAISYLIFNFLICII